MSIDDKIDLIIPLFGIVLGWLWLNEYSLFGAILIVFDDIKMNDK